MPMKEVSQSGRGPVLDEATVVLEQSGYWPAVTPEGPARGYRDDWAAISTTIFPRTRPASRSSNAPGT